MIERALVVRIVFVLGIASFPFLVSRLPAQDTTAGKQVYGKWCAGCHGDNGAGDGEAAPYMLPRPRDFTGAIYQIRSTGSGELPTDADLLRAIDQGLPGTAMPGWETRLSDRERRDVAAYLKTFSSFFADTTIRPQALQFSGAPGGGGSADALRIGRQFYDSIGCRKCHGDRGRGDGPSAATLKDDAGMPIFAADLTENWRFNGGGTAEDIYHRLRTGLDGTPMPSFSDLLDQKFLTDEQLWRVAQYVRSLSPAEPPVVRDVIHAPQRQGQLPRAPDDSAWAAVEAYWFPLVGQVIRKSRWFAPAVSGVWVQAVHTRDSLALRIVWDDRSQSPDTAWLAHVGRVLGAVASDDSIPAPAQPWPDQLAVQFPLTIPQGMERPYFLMGSASAPVYQWRWSSAGAGAAEGVARGVDRFDPRPASSLGGQAVYEAGQWRLVFTRALATPDTSSQLQFRTGRAIPVAFFALDGSNGERGTRMAVSTWYFLALDEPTPARVFISPVVAMALTLAFGMLVVWRARRRV
ncbi:MAG TPA: c-type cytochrome [Gemmatimonadales bacterium]|jgi:mono/diheme cytochrome c family protein|nr:c-type cytochrome [Gemmatimonadales bacterium]